MKILAATDIHGDKDLIKRLARRAAREKVDLVVLCGDLTFFEEDASGLIYPFKKGGKPVLLIPGNHESIATADFLAKLYSPKVYNLHGRGFKSGNVGFFGVGEANIGPFEIDEVDTMRLLNKAYKKVKTARSKVMVTHAPPYNTNLDNLGGTHVGFKSIRKAIEKFKPDIAICGHIHETFGIEDKIGKTKIINVGRNGKIITV